MCERANGAASLVQPISNVSEINFAGWESSLFCVLKTVHLCTVFMKQTKGQQPQLVTATESFTLIQHSVCVRIIFWFIKKRKKKKHNAVRIILTTN